MAGKHILIVDDELDIHRFLKAVLANAGYQTSSALDAMQGLMMVRQLKPDLIVLDVSMPAGGGAQIYERLRKMTGSIATPVLVYTKVPLAEVEGQIAPQANTRLLAKPAQPQDILSAVEELLGPS